MSATPELTYSEFGDSACPWLPDETFGQQNEQPIRGVMKVIAGLHPALSELVDFDPTSIPPDEQRAALWKLLMGRQHGVQEASDGKLEITEGEELLYLQHLLRIRHGRHPIMEASPIDPNTEYHQALLLGGAPNTNVLRIQAANRENVRNIVAQTGQRQRGIWGIPDESSPKALLDAVGAATGTDMDELVRLSPWADTEMALAQYQPWERPFDSEYEIYRLAGEAALFPLIDWKNYDHAVEEVEPFGPNDPIAYTDNGESGVIPSRKVGLVTYHLKDGRKFHVVNGRASPRKSGRPRATTSSIAEESIMYAELLDTPDDARLVSVASAPHLRGCLDMAIAFVHKAPAKVGRFDIAATQWTQETTSLMAALGEIMAGLKADLRLRAALRGDDPDSTILGGIKLGDF